MKRNRAYISVGSNIGDGIGNCRKGIETLTGGDGIEIIEVSHFFQTEPVGYTDQPWFVNAVFSIETDLSPLTLLNRLKQAERVTGRTETAIRFGPRIIDFDIVLYDDIVMETPELILPHPRMHQRRFVLLPLCDIAPDLIHPVLGIAMDRLLADLPTNGQQCRPVEEAIS